MARTSTKPVADKIVGALKAGLATVSSEELPTVRSVYLSGSYVRGDWLDASSDLDVTILYRPPEEVRSHSPEDLARIQAFARCLEPFPSQCPGGIDWSTQPGVPTSPEEARKVGPFLQHSIFLFDLRENLRVLWGDDVLQLLPPAPDPRPLAPQALDLLLSRMSKLGSDLESRRRAAFSSYKATLCAQVFFGKRTLSKMRILGLYLRNIPSFALREVGERIVRDYIGSWYPDGQPEYEETSYYVDFVRELRALLS